MWSTGKWIAEGPAGVPLRTDSLRCTPYLLIRSQFHSSKTVLLAAKGTLATFGFICTLELSSAFELSDSVNHPLVRRHRPLSSTRAFFDGSWIFLQNVGHFLSSRSWLPLLPKYGPFLQDSPLLLFYCWSCGLQNGINPSFLEMDLNFFFWFRPRMRPCDYVLYDLLGVSHNTVCFAESHGFRLCIILQSFTWKSSPICVWWSCARGKEKEPWR